jgi:hypothetical protein
MPLLLILFALVVPRITILVVWFFSNWFQGVFNTVLWPILGFIFLPTTLLWYTAVHHWFGGQWDVLPIVGLVVALIIDISPARPRRQRLVEAD